MLELLKQKFGGGGGNRTHVRQSAALGTTCLVQSLNLVARSPIDREFSNESV